MIILNPGPFESITGEKNKGCGKRMGFIDSRIPKLLECLSKAKATVIDLELFRPVLWSNKALVC